MNIHPDIQLMLIQQQMLQDQAQVANERAIRTLKANCTCREEPGRVPFLRNLANQLSNLLSAPQPAGALQLTPC